MVFSSFTFLFLFLPIFLLLYFIAQKRRTRNIILFLFSIAFYAWGEPVYIILMVFFLWINYWLGIFIESKQKKGLTGKKELVFTLIIDLTTLMIFKYSGIFTTGINQILGTNITIPAVRLPLGISFYTFQMLSYIIDLYKKNISAQRDFILLGTYLFAFPQLIAGPIVRYKEIEKSIISRQENIEEFIHGIQRFIFGLGKKVLIANTIGRVVDNLIGVEPTAISHIGVLIIMFGYTLQIYFDFSGYSDMAIGMGRMMGFEYPENFNYPYVSKSITDFWKRWHITLSSFFKDYVYIPLGGSRVGKVRWMYNILVVWGLIGLWHGAGANFIIWGLYFGIIIILERLFYGRYIEKIPIIRNLYVTIIFAFSMIIFKSDNLKQAGSLIKVLFSRYGGNIAEKLPINIILERCGADGVFWSIFIIGIILSTPILKLISNRFKENQAIIFYTKGITSICVFILCILFLINDTYNPFIYFRF
jgi:alginate O-acetyltransferase complex protein AlgI